MKVSIEELEEGDEIIISGCDLYYARVVRKPKLNPKKLHWYTKQPLYASVRLLISKKEFTEPNGYKYWKIELDPTDLNTAVYRDLNYKYIWLVKRVTSNI